jgi:arylsulfatase A-like enzyme
MLRNRYLWIAPVVLVAAVLAVLQIPASASHSPAHPCDLVASTQGSDADSGADVDHPLRTMQALVDRLGPGETGCLRGTGATAPFTENVTISNKNAAGGVAADRITIASYPGEVAKLVGRIAIDDTANRIAIRDLVLVGTTGASTVRLDGDDLLLADNNVTHPGNPCVRVGLLAQANRAQLLRNRIHDCEGDAITLGRSTYASLQGNLLYDSHGVAVKLSADADGNYLYRNIIDGNAQGIFLAGASGRFPEGNFMDSNVIANSTGKWNLSYSQMPGPAGNFLSQTCAYQAGNSNGGLLTAPPRGWAVWGPALPTSAPVYENRAKRDFRPADPSDPCFAGSGDVASLVNGAGGPNDEEASANNTRPNILFIITDDQRAEGTLTPEAMPQTVSRLKDQGVNFTNAFGTTPLCCPARASIMTGQYAHNHEVTNGNWAKDLNQDATIQAYLKQSAAGYRTGLFGKFLNGWDLTVNPKHWDQWSVFNDGYCPFFVNEQGTRKRYPALDPSTQAPAAGECDPARIGKDDLDPYSTDYLRDRALKFLDDGETDDATDAQPWFLYITPYAPHTPHTPEADYAGTPFSAFEDTPATFEDTSDKPPWVQQRAATRETVFGNATDPGRRLKQLRTLRSVDDLVGALLDQLKEKGEQDTLIVFISDNGYLWGDHGLIEKGAAYSAGAKVPLIMRYAPFTSPGKTDDSLVANIDLTPTALQAAGITPPSSPLLDGQSLLSPTAQRQRLHLEYYDHGPEDTDWAATRATDYLYIETYAEDGETLDFLEYYDLQADPYETTNLYGPNGVPGDGDDLGTPQHSVAELHDILRRDRFCEGTACPPGPGGGTTDTRPPRTLVTAPTQGGRVCCRVLLQARASDNIGVDRVEFRVDGNLIGTDSTEPYSVLWENTGAYAGGTHVIRAVAVDRSGLRTAAGSPGSAITAKLDKAGADIQIDDGGVPRTNCGGGPDPPPTCNIGTVNTGDTVTFTFPAPVAPGALIPGWDGTAPSSCAGDPAPLGCVTVGIKADSQADVYDHDTLGVYSDLAGTSRIALLGDVDLGDFDYIPFDTGGFPFRTWPRSAMSLSGDGSTVVVTLSPGTASLGDGEAGTARWKAPSCGCIVWESIDGLDTAQDREF